MKHILLIFGFTVIFGYLHLNFITTLGENVMDVPKKEKTVIQFFFPQGWGFFTRNPREPHYKLYKVEEGVPVLINYSITSSQNRFGLSRKGSRIGMELERIKSYLPGAGTWEKSTTSLELLPLDSLEYRCTAPITTVLYIQEGNYILKEYRLNPWSWAKHQGAQPKTYRYVPFQLVKS